LTKKNNEPIQQQKQTKATVTYRCMMAGLVIIDKSRVSARFSAFYVVDIDFGEVRSSVQEGQQAIAFFW